jgi:mevalonate pyrophosphate decarboxylase
MCPFCLSTVAWLALGGGSSAAGLAALFTAIKLKGNDHGDDRGR